MLKKLVLAITLALPMSAFSWANGPYVGLGVGADTVDFKQDARITHAADMNVRNKTELAAQGFYGTLFGGYSWSRNWLYLAGELNGDISSAKSTGSNREIIVHNFSYTIYKINRSWGISALPGIIIFGDAILYGRLGYSAGHYATETTDSSLANASKMLNGFRYGVGLQKRIYQNWNIRLDYSHINYESQTATTHTEVKKTTTVSPYTNQVEFGIMYQFA